MRRKEFEFYVPMKKIFARPAGKGMCAIILLLTIGIVQVESQTYCVSDTSEQVAGVQDGFRYEVWNQYSQGEACITLGEGALFSGTWDSIQNYLARRGLGYDTTQLHQELGTFYTTFDCEYHPRAELGGNSYLGVYGWTMNPLREFYVLEDWRNWIPSMAEGAELIDTITVNGSTYDIYSNMRVNQPSIIGITTFPQYFSIRRDTRTSGTINISDHFEKWEELGMDLGKMYEVSFVVEGYMNSGSFAFTELDVFVTEEIQGKKCEPDDVDTSKDTDQ